MNRINLNVNRSVGDIITFTFVFLRQEFKGIFKNFCILVLPLIFVDILVKGILIEYIITDTVDIYSFDSGEYINNLLVNYLVTIIVYIWTLLFMFSYMKIYNERYLKGDITPITYKELWVNMVHNLGPVLLWMFLYLMIVVIATMCLIVPGIWLGVLFIFTPALLIIKNKPFGEAAFNTSFISGEWWSTFAIILLFGIVVNLISWIFSIPFLLYTLMEGVTDMAENNLVLALLQGISVLGSGFLQVVTIAAIGLKFFSIQEKQEHQMLYRKIDNLGGSATQTANEGEF